MVFHNDIRLAIGVRLVFIGVNSNQVFCCTGVVPLQREDWYGGTPKRWVIESRLNFNELIDFHACLDIV